MPRNFQIGLIAALVVTVVAALAIALLLNDDAPPASSDPTPTPNPSVTAVGPTATGSPGPTSTPAPPTPTPTPQPPIGAAMAMALLVGQGKASPASLSLVSYTQVTWPDTSLDCPEPGESYAQVLTPGWRILLDNAGEEVEFHSDQSADLLFNCTERWAALDGAVKVYEIEGLAGTTLIEFARFNFDTQAFEKISEESDPADIQRFLDVLNVPILTVPADECQPIFRLTFRMPSRQVQLETICESNVRLVRGLASGWGGRDGIAPTQLGDLVGPYVPSDAPPFPPD